MDFSTASSSSESSGSLDSDYQEQVVSVPRKRARQSNTPFRASNNRAVNSQPLIPVNDVNITATVHNIVKPRLDHRLNLESINLTSRYSIYMSVWDLESLERVRKAAGVPLHGLGEHLFTLDNLLKYIGIVYMMDIHQMPRYKMHWTSRHYKCSIISLAMTQQRFSDIRCQMTMPDHHSHFLMETIEKKMDQIIKPSSYICIDEMLRKFMGQYKNKHRISNKPAKEGTGS